MPARANSRKLRLHWLVAAVFAGLSLPGDHLQAASRPMPFLWVRQFFDLPASIRVFEGSSTSEDARLFKAWYADVDYNDKSLQARPVLSREPGGRETASSMASKVGAYVAINGGYFDMSGRPAATYSLVESDGIVLSKNIDRISRPLRTYSVTRAAFGIAPDRDFDISWIAQFGDAIYAYPTPVPNTYFHPAEAASESYPPGGHRWDVRDAIGAGPVIVREGHLVDSFDAEVFFGSGFDAETAAPRAALGYTRNHHLILFVTDGRQADYSVGVTLEQMGQEMLNLGCVAAMSLDGGGSETLVVRDRAVNHPSDGQERAITSILAIVPAEEEHEDKAKVEKE